MGVIRKGEPVCAKAGENGVGRKEQGGGRGSAGVDKGFCNGPGGGGDAEVGQVAVGVRDTGVALV